MTASRGSYSTGTKSRLKLIEAASELLEEEGYQAISARRVAGRAKLKPQLVHYYFQSMEDLMITVFQRSSANYYRLHDEALSSPKPLHAIWELNSNMPEARRMFEYIALAKVYPGLREEMRKTGENFREQQIETIRRVFKERGINDPEVSADGLAGLLSAVARNFVIEDQVGVSRGHQEMEAFIKALLDRYEPAEQPSTLG